jgi:uncharacterized protein YcaQ
MQLDPGDKLFESICHDKWNTSWTYLFQRWMSIDMVLHTYADKVVFMLEEVLKKQQADGGWTSGDAESTREETAYVMGGLVSVLEKSKHHVLELPEQLANEIVVALEKAEQFIYKAANSNTEIYPSLWIAKNLSKPSWIDMEILVSLYHYYKFKLFA